MTLTEIAEAIDAQIVRMRKIRAILAILLPAEEMPAVEPTTEISLFEANGRFGGDSLLPDSVGVRAPVPKPKPREDAAPGTRAARFIVRRQTGVKEVVATALSGAVPPGPVVVSAADVIRSRVATETPTPGQMRSNASPPGHSLDDLVRQLTDRSASGFLDPPATGFSR